MKVRLSIPLVALVLAGAAFYYLGQWSGAQGSEDHTAIVAAERALAAGKAWRARRVTLLAAAQAHADTARRLAAQAETREPVIVALDTVIARATSSGDSLAGLVMQNVQLRRQSAERGAALIQMTRARWADSTRADDAERRVTDLELHLDHILDIADCHLLGVKFLPRCPNRTVSFVAGLVGGAALVVIVR